jgi:hypothetical protein
LLVEVAGVRLAAGGRETKAAVVYQYLTGARFKQHMQAIVEAFTTMQEDWGRRREQSRSSGRRGRCRLRG